MCDVEQRRRRANPLGSLWLLFRSRVLVLLGLTMLFSLFASSGASTLQTLYWQTTFDWNPATIGAGKFPCFRVVRY